MEITKEKLLLFLVAFLCLLLSLIFFFSSIFAGYSIIFSFFYALLHSPRSCTSSFRSLFSLHFILFEAKNSKQEHTKKIGNDATSIWLKCDRNRWISLHMISCRTLKKRYHQRILVGDRPSIPRNYEITDDQVYCTKANYAIIRR